jgi:hypothetical protein
MRRNRYITERGEGLIEFVFYLAIAGGAMAAAGYFLVYANQDKRLSYEQQAYVIAIATQRADAYIRAVATQQAGAPPAAPAAAPVQVAPPPQAPLAAAPTPTVYVPQQPAPTSPPPLPTAPPAPTKPPMATCVGYMAGFAQDGLDACREIDAAAGTDAGVRNCISDIIGGTATTPAGQADCVQAALHTSSDTNLSDCFLGLSGQSHFGRQSCRQYYGSQ